jgi:Mn2+/Fe2+ NRAMP family transporter
MNKFLAITLGIVSSIGGFFDMGEIVMTAETGARFGFGLVWVVILGTIGIIVYAEMAGRIATLSKRPVFDIVRERLGAKVGFLNLSASVLINLITLIAEVAGVAIAFQLVSSVNYYLWIPLAVILVLIVIWKVSFEHMERAIGFLGMAMLVFAFAFFKLGPDLGAVFKKIVEPDVPKSETLAAYWYFAVALFGAAMTPYEVFFYSSGAVEEKWEKRDLLVNKVTAYVGFAFGAFLATTAIGVAALLFKPQGISIETLSQVALGPAATIGTIGLALFIVGLFAATFGAALEVTLSTGYCLAQYFGWTWGKFEKPRDAARFHLSMIVLVIIAALLLLTSVDPVKVTELAVVFSAIGLPLTYFPVLVVANDAEYMGDKVNGKALNLVASLYLLVVVAVSVSAIPLMIWTKMGS